MLNKYWVDLVSNRDEIPIALQTYHPLEALRSAGDAYHVFFDEIENTGTYKITLEVPQWLQEGAALFKELIFEKSADGNQFITTKQPNFAIKGYIVTKVWIDIIKDEKNTGVYTTNITWVKEHAKPLSGLTTFYRWRR